MSDEKKPEARLTRENAEVLIASPGLWGRSEQGPMAYALLAHFDATEAAIAAQRKEIERLRETVKRLAAALREIRAWDHMDTAADGAFWRAEIDKLLEEAGE